MKRNLVTALLLAVASIVMAQPEAGTFSIIPRIGVAFSTLTKDMIYVQSENDATELSSKWKAGMVAGVDFDYQVLPKISVSAGAYYSEQGCKYDSYQTPDNSISGGSHHIGVSNLQASLKYINVPIMLNMYAAQNFAVKLGVQFGFNLDATTEMTETSFTINDDKTTSYGKPVTTKMDMNARNFEFAIPLGVSYEYMNVIVDARYNLGLTPIVKYAGSYSPQNNVITISAGYRFTL